MDPTVQAQKPIPSMAQIGLETLEKEYAPWKVDFLEHHFASREREGHEYDFDNEFHSLMAFAVASRQAGIKLESLKRNLATEAWQVALSDVKELEHHFDFPGIEFKAKDALHMIHWHLWCRITGSREQDDSGSPFLRKQRAAREAMIRLYQAYEVLERKPFLLDMPTQAQELAHVQKLLGRLLDRLCEDVLLTTSDLEDFERCVKFMTGLVYQDTHPTRLTSTQVHVALRVVLAYIANPENQDQGDAALLLQDRGGISNGIRKFIRALRDPHYARDEYMMEFLGKLRVDMQTFEQPSGFRQGGTLE